MSYVHSNQVRHLLTYWAVEVSPCCICESRELQLSFQIHKNILNPTIHAAILQLHCEELYVTIVFYRQGQSFILNLTAYTIK